MNAPNDRLDETEVAASRRWTSPDTPLVGPETPGTSRVSEPRGEAEQSPLFSGEESTQLRSRWEAVQAGFVDEPRRAVEEADDLVQTVMDRLSNGFKQQRERLEHEWGDRDEVSTEDLRLALRHYRSFFDRLLNV